MNNYTTTLTPCTVFNLFYFLCGSQFLRVHFDSQNCNGGQGCEIGRNLSIAKHSKLLQNYLQNCHFPDLKTSLGAFSSQQYWVIL